MARLGDVCEIAAGQGAPQGENNYCSYNEGIPFIKAGDLSNLLSGKQENEIQCVKETVAKQYKLKLYPAGSILFAKSGMSCMKGYVYRTKQPCYVVSHLAIVIPQKVDGEYLKYYFQYNKPNFLIKDSAYPSISLQDISNMEVKLPSLEIQMSIANELNKVNGLISLRQQQLAKLDELVKSRFIEMFGDPTTNPKGWLETTIGKECYYIKDGPHKSLEDVGEGNGYPFISVRNIVNGVIDFSTARYISEQDYIESIKKCHPQKGDMLYSKGGTTGIAKLIDIDIEFANWVHVAVLKFDESLNGVFFENMLNSDYCYTQSQKLTKGIANRDLVLGAMAQIQFYKPPLHLQQQFAAFVKQTDKSKSEIQKSLEKLETLKKALMQKYFG